jgi:large subunit ribosomal protein L13
VLDSLGIAAHTLLWNVVPTHPGTETSNRRPTRAEIESSRPFLEQLAAGRIVVAVGRVAAETLDAPSIRHPAHGGARVFAEGLREALAGVRFRYNPAPADARVRLFSVMKTYSAKPGEITREWYLVDADGQTLGRLATQIADTLRGKRKPQFTPHVDTGDFVIVVNAEKIVTTGAKLDQKRYYRHSGYPGGLSSRTLREQLERRPTEVIRSAVKGMLPKNKLAARQLTKLKIYAGPEHPHGPQNPKPLTLEQ